VDGHPKIKLHIFDGLSLVRLLSCYGARLSYVGRLRHLQQLQATPSQPQAVSAGPATSHMDTRANMERTFSITMPSIVGIVGYHRLLIKKCDVMLSVCHALAFQRSSSESSTVKSSTVKVAL